MSLKQHGLYLHFDVCACIIIEGRLTYHTHQHFTHSCRILLHGSFYQVLARLEQRRRDWDDKLERMKEVSRAARQQNAVEERERSGIQIGTTAAVGNKVCQSVDSEREGNDVSEGERRVVGY